MAGAKRSACPRAIYSPDIGPSTSKRRSPKAATPQSSKKSKENVEPTTSKRRSAKDSSSPSTSKPKAPATTPKTVVPKKVKSPTTVANDPNEYEVQCIKSHTFWPNDLDRLSYNTKWKNYGEDENTYEYESSFAVYHTLYTYWTGVYNSGKAKDKGLKGIAAAALIQHEMQGETIRCYIDESMFYKRLINDDMIQKYGWSNYISSNTPRNCRAQSLHQYNSILSLITRLCPNYPDVQVTNEFDRFKPMDIANFLPFSVRPDMIFMEKEKIKPFCMDDFFEKDGKVLKCSICDEQIPAEKYKNNENSLFHLRRYHSDQVPQNDDQILSEKNLFRAMRILKSLQKNNLNRNSIFEGSILDEEIRVQALFDRNELRPNKTDVQLPCKLELRRTEELCWELVTLTEIEKGDVITPITGEVVNVSEAEKCFREEGELIAFKHFIALPKRTNLCLDRRRRSDYTRYIQHSCDPNCFVQSAVYGDTGSVGIPLMYLLAKKKIPAGTVLSIDYFVHMRLPAKFENKKLDWEARIAFSEESRDHVWCTCGSRNCRGVLWVEDLSKKDCKAKKVDKIKKTRIDGITQFRGLDVRPKE